MPLKIRKLKNKRGHTSSAAALLQLMPSRLPLKRRGPTVMLTANLAKAGRGKKRQPPAPISITTIAARRCPPLLAPSILTPRPFPPRSGWMPRTWCCSSFCSATAAGAPSARKLAPHQLLRLLLRRGWWGGAPEEEPLPLPQLRLRDERRWRASGSG